MRMTLYCPDPFRINTMSAALVAGQRTWYAEWRSARKQERLIQEVGVVFKDTIWFSYCQWQEKEGAFQKFTKITKQNMNPFQKNRKVVVPNGKVSWNFDACGVMRKDNLNGRLILFKKCRAMWSNVLAKVWDNPQSWNNLRISSLKDISSKSFFLRLWMTYCLVDDWTHNWSAQRETKLPFKLDCKVSVRSGNIVLDWQMCPKKYM